MNIVELKDKKISELNVMAKNFKIDGAAGMRKQDLIFALLQAEIENSSPKSWLRRWCTIVVFPEPEGAEMMISLPLWIDFFITLSLLLLSLLYDYGMTVE